MFQKVNKFLCPFKNYIISSNRRKIALFFKIYMFFVPDFIRIDPITEGVNSIIRQKLFYS